MFMYLILAALKIKAREERRRKRRGGEERKEK